MRKVTIYTEGPAIITQKWEFSIPDEITALPADPDEALEFLENHHVPSTSSITSMLADQPTAFEIDLTELT